MNTFNFQCLIARQAKNFKVVSFVATAQEIGKIARISRVGRTDDQELFGFQRTQIGHHIQEIHDYLETDEAVLPNSIILAFTSGVTLTEVNGNFAQLEVSVSNENMGLIVDGQQRFSALSMLDEKEFEVFVSAIICKDEAELQKQFILINNTKPLPKELIYELLPSTEDIPPRLRSRAFASKITQELNFIKGGVFEGLIKLHTNPNGVFVSTALHKIIMGSKRDGAMREIFKLKGEDGCLEILNEYFEAVRVVFEDDWFQKDDEKRVLGLHNARTSRLIHSAGITCIGYLMDAIFTWGGARTKGQFIDNLILIKDYTAWSGGMWDFKPNARHWSEIQNTGKDLNQLRDFLLSSYMTEVRKRNEKAS